MAAPLCFDLPVSIDVEAVIATAILAGDTILRVYEGGEETWGVEHKADSSPLTRADNLANALICGASRRRERGGCER